MAWRFKVSKYRNAAPVVPRREDCVGDLRVGAPQSCGNHLAASAAWVAFCLQNRGGGSLGVVSLGYKGRLDPSAPLIHAHSSQITDFSFSPFHDGLLATGSTDADVHLWHIPESGLSESLSTPECSLPTQERRIETVTFHPTADCLLSVSCHTTIKLWDILHQRQLYSYSQHEDQVLGLSWCGDGKLFATFCKDRQLRVVDPRTDTTASQTEAHGSSKDGRVVWLEGPHHILTTGWDASRVREVRLWDNRAMNSPYKVLTLDAATGVLMPLYDADTNMLFLAGKADVSISYWEVSTREPHLTEAFKHTGNQQTKGACLVPKRGLDVMSAEVNKVLQLTPTSLIPLSYQVPRKSYREFHADLFPDTPGHEPSCTAIQWWEGQDGSGRAKISLDPSHRTTPTLQVHRGPLSQQAPASHPHEAPVPVPAPRSRGPQLKGPTPTPKPCVAVKPSLMSTTTTTTTTTTTKTTTSSNGPKPAMRSSFSIKQSLKEQSLEDEIKALKQQKEVIVAREEDQSPPATPQSNTAQIRNALQSKSAGVPPAQPPQDAPGTPRSGSVSRLLKQYQEKVKQVTDEADNSSLTSKNPPSDGEKDGWDSAGRAEERCVVLRQRVATWGIQNTNQDKAPSPALTRSFRRVCKYRHLEGQSGHKSSWLDNVRDVSRSTPSECDGLAANGVLAAIPLTGAGGRLWVVEHARGGCRAPEGVLPAILNGSAALDFSFNPFSDSCLAVGCDDGRVNIWQVPEAGYSQPCNTPFSTLSHPSCSHKANVLRWHPLASGVLAVASGDRNVRLWDLQAASPELILPPCPDQLFSMAWSPCGRYLATLGREGHMRVLEPRMCSRPLLEGSAGPVGARGGRILWVLGGKHLLTVGFSRVSERQISVYESSDLTQALNTVGVDISPAMLLPHYDPDSNTLFTTAKGDSTIYTHEVGRDFPHLFPLTHHKCSTPHLAVVALPKHLCNVRQVEFCKMLRLTNSTLEPLAFTVPRVKTEYFQDDLFPNTLVTWEPVSTSGDWFSGIDRPPRHLSLRPPDMVSLSEGRQQQQQQQQQALVQEGGTVGSVLGSSTHFLQAVTDPSIRQTQDKLEAEMSSVVGPASSDLAQDSMEGVDSAEWED